MRNLHPMEMDQQQREMFLAARTAARECSKELGTSIGLSRREGPVNAPPLPNIDDFIADWTINLQWMVYRDGESVQWVPLSCCRRAAVLAAKFCFGSYLKGGDMELEVAIPQVGIAIAEKYMDLNGYVKKTSLSDDDYETEKQNALQTLFICQFPSSRKEDITDMLQATEKFFGECYSCTKDVPPLVCLGK